MQSDLEIARQATLRPIAEIAEAYGITDEELEPYGRWKAKVNLSVLDRLKDAPRGKYIDITAVTPTPLGEGKTVSTIGLSLGLNHIGRNVMTTLRQPSLGPVFGIKGGAAGGGYSQVIPMEEMNLHLTGDIHAVALANNLACAFLDNHVGRGMEPIVDPETIALRRGVDVNDRSLRRIRTGIDTKHCEEMDTGFDIAVASEVMAILALADDIHDLRARLGRMVVALDTDGNPVTADDIKVAGAMTALLMEAIKPTLMQTTEGTAALVHCGPFANIAHGNNSIVADRIALALADYVVTESGFGADMGMEKFMNIKCRQSGMTPDAVGMIATVRALKSHSGQFDIVPGKPLPDDLYDENVKAVEAGAGNLTKQIENARKFGVPVVCAVNHFPNDHDSEVEAVREIAEAAGAEAAVVSRVHAEGGKGGAEFAEAIADAADKPNDFKFLYPDDMPLRDKIRTIATEIYGADGVEFEPKADKQLDTYERLGYGNFQVCMAKTHLSLSHDASLKGAPSGFTVPIRDVRASVGAGFIYPLCGSMMTMPGLGSNPAGWRIDIDENGEITGLS